MHNLPVLEKTQRTVNMMGGEERVFAEYQRATDAKEFLWAKDLAVKLYNLDPANPTYRQELANTFRELGQRSPGSIVRNFYLSSARSLEGDENVTLTAVESEQWIKSDLKRAVNHLRVRVLPEESKGLDHMIKFDIDGEQVGLHVRNSIAEFVENPAEHYKQPDTTIRLNASEFVDYYRGKTPVKGLEMFEMFKQIPMYPTEHQQG